MVKRTDPSAGEFEAEITSLAHSLARDSGLFCVPRILRFGRREGIIEFERIKGFRTIGQMLARPGKDEKLIARAGRSLGCIHRGLKVPGRLARRPEYLRQGLQEGCVALHGDFNTINVGYEEDSDSIVVLDWASAPVLGRRVTVGPRYLDLASFLRSLLVHQADFFKAMRRFRRRSEAFLHGYHTEAGCKADPKLLGEFLVRLSALHLQAGCREGAIFVRGLRRAVGAAAHLFFINAAKRWLRTKPICFKTAA